MATALPSALGWDAIAVFIQLVPNMRGMRCENTARIKAYGLRFVVLVVATRGIGAGMIRSNERFGNVLSFSEVLN
jgi:hypothetical protein